MAEPFVVSEDMFSYMNFVDGEENYHKNVHIKKALTLAKSSQLDLVCFITDSEDGLPLCKLIDYGKWKYQNVKIKKKHVKKCEIKEIRFTPVIGEHDIEHKVKHIQEFINDGHEIIASMKIKGRQSKAVADEKMQYIVDKCLPFSSVIAKKEENGLITVRLSKKKKETVE